MGIYTYIPGGAAKKNRPSTPDMSSLSLSCLSYSLETADMKSSSVSIPAVDVVVTGVGGAISGPAEARILLFGVVAAEDIVASAAFRLRVRGGMMPAYECRLELVQAPPNKTAKGCRGKRSVVV